MKTILVLALAVFFNSAQAVDKTTLEKIVIGQSVELSGEATGKENMEGAQAYFKWVNSQGGVYGRQIELKTYDDKRKPDITRTNTEKLIKEDHALALFGYRSTPTVEAALPLLISEKIPMIAPFSGAQVLHQPLNPYLFHLRASYQDETKKMVETLMPLGISRIAILYQDDSFGKDGLVGFKQSLALNRVKALVEASYDRKDLKIDNAVNLIASANPQAVLMACTPSVCADFVKQVHTRNFYPRFLMLSNVSSDSFFKSLGDDGRGVGIMQVMPYPKDIGVLVVREFQHVLKGMDNPPPISYATLEGFVAAKLLTEGLRRAGPSVNREKLMAAFNSMRNFDLGGVKVTYTPNSHEGSKFVELTVVGKNGVIQR
ncbi:ABC transporter substrate-binding protein [Undibacterium sp. RuTC16W]|uniref:ABC transporter substrate-binding protein n=1 Tax=Undibacterium sp. RuTC16W TaxID=3413048 RepID=UPI003BF1288B